MRRPIIVFVVLFILQFLGGCVTCADTILEDYRVQGFELRAQRINGYLPQYITNESVRSDSLMFELGAFVVFESEFVPLASFASTASACSPPDPLFLDRINKVEIRTNRDYAGGLPGSDISAYFNYTEFALTDRIDQSINYASNLDTIEDVSSIWYITFWSFEDVEPGDYMFTFEIFLEDGRSFELATEEISIT